MYVDIVPNRNSPPAVLVRESWREGKITKKRTIANISHWPMDKVLALRQLLKGETLIPAREAFAIERSIPHGHVAAILGTVKKLGLDKIISAAPCRQRDLAAAMIVQRLVEPGSTLATTRLWHTSTLAAELGVADASEQDLYDALDWLLARKDRIEKRLAARHLSEGALALYDVSSSYYEGHTCTLAQFGHNRDGKKGKQIIVYGLLTDGEGRPVAVDVYPGNTGDPSTVPDQVNKLRERFGLERAVLVGDRGMLTSTKIKLLKKHPGLGWISALRGRAVRELLTGGSLQLSLFDERDIAEISSPQFAGERLVACYNPLLAAERGRKRNELVAATERKLEKIRREVARRTKTPLSRDEISKKVYRAANKFKVEKHFIIKIDDGHLEYHRNEDSIKQETALDGIYVIRTSEPAGRMSAADAVRNYKRLATVEQAFRCLKGLDVRIRPIYHRTEDHVRAHIFVCMLAYYVERHMRAALAPFLFDDEQLDTDRVTRDPVKPATPSAGAKTKKAARVTPEGLPVHSFETLIAELGTLCRNRCRAKSIPDSPAFYQDTEPTPLQEEVFKRLGLCPVSR
jgi:hypothetical protein